MGQFIKAEKSLLGSRNLGVDYRAKKTHQCEDGRLSLRCWKGLRQQQNCQSKIIYSAKNQSDMKAKSDIFI